MLIKIWCNNTFYKYIFKFFYCSFINMTIDCNNAAKSRRGGRLISGFVSLQDVLGDGNPAGISMLDDNARCLTECTDTLKCRISIGNSREVSVYKSYASRRTLSSRAVCVQP